MGFLATSGLIKAQSGTVNLPAGTDRVLAAFVFYHETTDQNTSPTYGGNPATGEIGDFALEGNECGLELHYWLEADLPADGNNTFDIGVAPDQPGFGVIILDSRNQGAPDDFGDVSNHLVGDGNTISVTLTAAADDSDAVSAAVSRDVSTFTHGTGQVEDWDDSLHITDYGATGTHETGIASGSETQEHTTSSGDRKAMKAAIWQPAATATAGQVTEDASSRIIHVPETLQRSTRLEASRTNNLTQSEAFDHADWTKVGTPVITADDAVAPDGTLTADKIEDDDGAGFEFVRQDITVPDDSLDRVASVFVRKQTVFTSTVEFGLDYRTGTTIIQYKVQLNPVTGVLDATRKDTPTAFGVEDLGSYWRLWVVGPNNATGNTTVRAVAIPAINATGADGSEDASATGSAHVWGAQLEGVSGGASFPSSYIATTTAAVTRSADSLSVDISGTPLATPQEMTVYCKWVSGTPSEGVSSQRIIQVGTNSDPHFRIIKETNRVTVIYATPGGDSRANPIVTYEPGDVLEYRAVLHGDGDVDGEVHKNGSQANEVIGATGGDALPGAWSGATFHVGEGGEGGNTCYDNFIAVTIESGVQTMAQMRSLADAKAGDLYSYYPGDTGLTFSRASVATHRTATRELATAASGELRDAHYVPRRVDGEVTETASARIAIQSERTGSASARVASRAERAETASLRAALRGEARTLSSLSTALRGEQSEDASLRAALRGATSEAGSADVAQTGEQSEVVSLRAALAGAVAEAASLVSALAGQLSEDATVRAALREAVAAASSLRVALQSEVSDVASLRAALRAEQQADASMRITTVQEGEVTSAASIRASVQGEAAVLSSMRAALLGETAVDMSALIAARAEVEAAATGRIERVDQILRPDADVANPDAWVNELGATTGLWQSLDEVVPDHTDWIEGPP